MRASIEDEDLLEGFTRGTLPPGEFHHAAHVRVAWLFVCRYGMPAALEKFSSALRAFAAAAGAPHLYHVTITWAYLLLIDARQQAAPAADWQQFAAANPDLLAWKPSVLDHYYTADTLWSDFARHTFVLPDRGLRTP